jgi:Fur family ferric uptake transcriptional regulator
MTSHDHHGNGNGHTRSAAERLREHGLRVTPQRRAILEVFTPDTGHLSADQVYERAAKEVPEIARATVYNTLADLLEAGLLRKVDGLGAVLYELSVDEGHHHFHCSDCGKLFDVNPGGAGGLDLPGGFRVDRTQIMFEGLCSDCAAKAAA